ncbi:MAG: hypothetical protein M1834_004927 [Cirrosporium novae-zelandiae]|nr:MAG: hypothetical protein M1834_004927 [Cirrosporium novae-zelandiae]
MFTPPGPRPDPSFIDDSRASYLLEVTFSIVGFATVFVGLRFFTRAKWLGNIGVDDWLMLAAMIFSIASAAFMIPATRSGLGRHYMYLTEEEITGAFKWEFFINWNCVLAFGFQKFSIAIMLWRFMRAVRIYACWLYFCMLLSTAISCFGMLIILLMCSPINKIWDIKVPGKCWSNDHFLAAEYAYGDAQINLYVWNGVEINVSIIAASIPPMKPLLEALFVKLGLANVLCNNRYSRQRDSRGISRAGHSLQSVNGVGKKKQRRERHSEETGAILEEGNAPPLPKKPNQGILRTQVFEVSYQTYSENEEERRSDTCSLNRPQNWVPGDSF